MKKDRRGVLRIASADTKDHRHSANPFTEGWQPTLIERNKRVDLKAKNIADEQGNKVEGILLVPYKRDGGRFVKLVHSELQVLTKLSRAAYSVLAFVMHQAMPRNAVVWLHHEEACQWCSFAQAKSFYDGVNELIIYQYLARTEKPGFYFLNPQMIFNGNRREIKNNFRKPKHEA